LAHSPSRDVFLNCPFDETYWPLFRAIVFAVADLGFVARCALEVDDASINRLEKILSIIESCGYGIHDISAVELAPGTNLPRFNMPLELGLFLGCKRFGGTKHRNKACLILDREPYRYRASMSDISGQDIAWHEGNPKRAILKVRDWLTTASGIKGQPGGQQIMDDFERFERDLPELCQQLKRQPAELTFGDFVEVVEIWLESSR
jgi:hypothetical protein